MGPFLKATCPDLESCGCDAHCDVRIVQMLAALCTHIRPMPLLMRWRAVRPIGCWVEALAMLGLPNGVPVASYGSCGSEHFVANIRTAVIPGVPALLLANHGVVVFHRSPELAILVVGVVEESAMAGINAESIGGLIEIPEARRGASLQRAMTFEGMGIQHA
jgi:ribulose-5-phosphate 4-epimerase/fuculose-1-phosphate aldolase